MQITVRLFAGLRERAGTAELTLVLPDGARVADALAELELVVAGAELVTAVNREYASAEQALAPGDELALIPPVSGGALPAQKYTYEFTAEEGWGGGVRAVRIGPEPLSIDRLARLVADPHAGAVVTFSGVTRDVDHLEYEAYAEMALSQMTRIAEEAVARHGLCAVAVEHRTGVVALGEASVAIAASAPHRAEAFAGARETIDRIKELVPIWKRESGAWVAGTLPAPDGANG